MEAHSVIQGRAWLLPLSRRGVRRRSGQEELRKLHLQVGTEGERLQKSLDALLVGRQVERLILPHRDPVPSA